MNPARVFLALSALVAMIALLIRRDLRRDKSTSPRFIASMIGGSVVAFLALVW